MSTLFIHAGHNKTGSSYVQHFLRSNNKGLQKYGISYAIGSDAKLAPETSISAGNAISLFRSRESFESILKINRRVTNQSLLLSSEYVFFDFIKSNAEEYLEEIALRNGFDRIKIIIFIRNPVSLMVSQWQNWIRRNGLTDIDFSDKREMKGLLPQSLMLVEKWMDRIEKCNFTDLTIKNYSNCKSHILDEVTNWLELPSGVLSPPQPKWINRSMTYSELYLISQFNPFWGRQTICCQIPFVKN